MLRRAWTVLPWQRILAATDFSVDSEAALRAAAAAARACHSELTLAHSLPHLRRAAWSAVWASRIPADSPEGEAFQRQLCKQSDDQLRQQAESVRHEGFADISLQTQTLSGEPWVELIHAVQEGQFDVLFAGSRGQSAWSELLTGSTSRKLIRHCPCDVCIVRGSAISAPRRILAAADFSDVSCRAVSRALWLGSLFDAEVRVMHVVELTDVPEDLADRATTVRSVRDVIREEAADRLRQFLQELPAASVVTHQQTVFGDPWRELRRYAGEMNAEMIVCGTTGRGGLKGLLLGNTAERLLDHGGCSVLAVKPAHFQCPVERATWPVGSYSPRNSAEMAASESASGRG